MAKVRIKEGNLPNIKSQFLSQFPGFSQVSDLDPLTKREGRPQEEGSSNATQCVHHNNPPQSDLQPFT